MKKLILTLCCLVLAACSSTGLSNLVPQNHIEQVAKNIIMQEIYKNDTIMYSTKDGIPAHGGGVVYMHFVFSADNPQGGIAIVSQNYEFATDGSENFYTIPFVIHTQNDETIIMMPAGSDNPNQALSIHKKDEGFILMHGLEYVEDHSFGALEKREAPEIE